MYDWDKSTAMLAAQAPWWEPRTASGYHALTYALTKMVPCMIVGPLAAALVERLYGILND